jgi:hypothetical protein
MSFENFNRDLILQVDNDIYHHGSEPEEIDSEYYFFVFTKYNVSSNERWEFPEFTNNWRIVGQSWLGDWRETQINGPGPIDNLYTNEMNVRAMLNEYVSRGVLIDFKIRYRFPTVL